MTDQSTTKLALAFQLATLDVLKAKGCLGDADLEAIASAALTMCAAADPGAPSAASGQAPAVGRQD